MDLDRFERIKRWTIMGLFADDHLMDTLVLKGGNALDIVYGITARASLDVDISISEDFKEDLAVIEGRACAGLQKVFRTEGYEVFDVKLERKPEVQGKNTPNFWGGYQLNFKIIERGRVSSYGEDLAGARRNSEIVGPEHRRIFKVDISKYEYCDSKVAEQLDGYTVYVYTPEMIVFEKLRAICQQMPDYTAAIGKRTSTPRAKDFFDIYTTLEKFRIDITSQKNLGLLRAVFSAKQVPSRLLSLVKNYREYHATDYASIEATVRRNAQLNGFDFYFDYVIQKCELLAKALGVV